jgi:hypothetical protein
VLTPAEAATNMLKSYSSYKVAREMALFHQMDHWEDRATTGSFGWNYWGSVRIEIDRIIEERTQ